MKNIQLFPSTINKTTFKKSYVGCVVLTKDQKIILQQRGNDWDHYPGYLAEFGGRIEPEETPEEALVRELQEELGAKVNSKDAISLGALTEDTSNHEELIYVYFWQDKEGSITGCYEGEPRCFDDVNAVLDGNKITAGLKWLLLKCKELKLVK